jgi:hypothetical protein
MKPTAFNCTESLVEKESEMYFLKGNVRAGTFRSNVCHGHGIRMAHYLEVELKASTLVI